MEQIKNTRSGFDPDPQKTVRSGSDPDSLPPLLVERYLNADRTDNLRCQNSRSLPLAATWPLKKGPRLSISQIFGWFQLFKVVIYAVKRFLRRAKATLCMFLRRIGTRFRDTVC